MSLVKNKLQNPQKLDNEQLSIDYLLEQIKEKPKKKSLYWQLVKLVSRKKFDISDHELWQLKSLDNFAPNNELDWLANYAIYNVETRINNHRELSKHNCKIVSLGSNCMSRTIPTRWGLKLSKSMGELTHPFDLSIHPYNSVCQVIENEFQDYLDPILLKKNHNGVPKHKKYQIVFNHERDSYFSQNNFRQLIKIYEARIKNFYHDVNKYSIIFLYFNKPKENIFPLELAKIIQNKFKEVNHKLLYINTGEKNFGPDDSQFPENLIAKHIRLPSEDYNWSQPQHYATEPGKNFELSIIEAIKQVLIDYFPKN
ncbi:Putative papain-like cysteine peptidase (DUF1796) [Xenococcus sp. PCC 7305]|uniref:DUF1796 family putative cysteine peptidase n=1 Tax=Xenococcus sp. PCC 7305 TaxID=102125 RepID=UPI0002ACA6DC|nr:DUF1796 family putative cysteine peptidase [Xenococcus sp. PCC 7305]ELS00524.1 Putative papain-like cysteine peptidase (DUF1796) [Xenococcus sp. PCC 7305]